MVDAMTRYDVFCTVVETGSFTRTAEALGYTQSAVSQNVAALENELSAARMIVNGLQLGLPADTIRTRLRELYF